VHCDKALSERFVANAMAYRNGKDDDSSRTQTKNRPTSLLHSFVLMSAIDCCVVCECALAYQSEYSAHDL